MNKYFRKIQKLCQRATAIDGLDTKAPCQIDTQLPKLRAAIRDYSDAGEDCVTALFNDETHGELELFHVGEAKDAAKYNANEIYQLNDGEGGFVTFTGEQFESIVKQFNSYRK